MSDFEFTIGLMIILGTFLYIVGCIGLFMLKLIIYRGYGRMKARGEFNRKKKEYQMQNLTRAKR